MTINEGMVYLKSLRERHNELKALRDQNSAVHVRRYGIAADKEVEMKPTYDAKALDRRVTQVATEIRKLEFAIKATNAMTAIQNYTPDDAVFAPIE